MTVFYRVTGTLLASYAPAYEETDQIDLDLIVLATSPAWAEGEARMIAARDYDWLRWAVRPTIEEVKDE